MKLKVKSTVGLVTPMEIDVEPTETVREVKEKIATMQVAESKGIALQYNGKPMDDNSRLKEYGITEGDTNTRFISIKKRAKVNGEFRVVSAIALKPEEFEQIKSVKME